MFGVLLMSVLRFASKFKNNVSIRGCCYAAIPLDKIYRFGHNDAQCCYAMRSAPFLKQRRRDMLTFLVALMSLSAVPGSQPASRPVSVASRPASQPLNHNRASIKDVRDAVKAGQVIEGMSLAEAKAAMKGCRQTIQKDGRDLVCVWEVTKSVSALAGMDPRAVPSREAGRLASEKRTVVTRKVKATIVSGLVTDVRTVEMGKVVVGMTLGDANEAMSGHGRAEEKTTSNNGTIYEWVLGGGFSMVGGRRIWSPMEVMQATVRNEKIVKVEKKIYGSPSQME
jgi:hypothetical protein